MKLMLAEDEPGLSRALTAFFNIATTRSTPPSTA